MSLDGAGAAAKTQPIKLFVRACAAGCRVMTWFSVAIVMFLAFPVAYDAVMRSFGRPTIWAFEVTLYMLIAGGLLANAVALETGAHFRVTLLVTLFPSWRRALNIFSLSMTLLFSVIIFCAGCYFVWYSWSNNILSNSLLEVPLFIPQLALPLGGLALFLQALILLITGEEPRDNEYATVEI